MASLRWLYARSVPWSVLCETMRSLTSPHTKRISGPRKFRSSPKKDFCNNICQRATSTQSRSVRSGGRDRKLKESTPRLALGRPQPPTMGFDNRAADREAHAHAVGLRRVEGFKEARQALRA